MSRPTSELVTRDPLLRWQTEDSIAKTAFPTCSMKFHAGIGKLIRFDQPAEEVWLQPPFEGPWRNRNAEHALPNGADSLSRGLRTVVRVLAGYGDTNRRS